MPKSWQINNYQLKDINGFRTLAGLDGNFLLINLEPSPDSKITGRLGKIPAVYDLSSHKYALLLDGRPLIWLNPDIPIDQQSELITQADLDQISKTMVYAYDIKGNAVSGLNATFADTDGSTVQSIGAFTLTLPDDNSTPVSYTMLPASDGSKEKQQATANDRWD